MFYSWRGAYFTSIALRFVLAVANSYIHPDEHFQSFEVLCSKWLGYHTAIPWEFTVDAPARSYASLYIVYYPLFKIFGGILLPLQLWYVSRLFLMVVCWLITDWCLYKMLPSKQERIKSIFFTLTSYVTLVYQSHTFSNLIETVLLVLAVYIINELRFLRSQPGDYVSESSWLASALGVIVSFGIFNRITFPAFLILPSVHLVSIFWQLKRLPFLALTTFLATSLVCITIDSIAYGTISSISFNWRDYTLAPLNSLLYNSSYSNLATHGIHPRYTHILINLPQLLGPGLILVANKGKPRFWNTIPFLSAVSGLIFLSVIPHQELRFLIPIVPLLCSCFDIASVSSTLFSKILPLWYIFNVIMAVLMGIYHQGGVVTAMDYIYQNPQNNTAYIWWRTYTPPSWMLADTTNSTQIVHARFGVTIDELFPEKNNYFIDTMGLHHELLKETISSMQAKTNKTIQLVTPIASFDTTFDSSLYRQVWKTLAHLDLDHLDWSDRRSLTPGLAIYELL